MCSCFFLLLLIFVQGEDSPHLGSWKKLDFIPKNYMGVVIGRNHEQLNDIERNTGATLKAGPKSNRDGALYIKGPIESQKRAIRKIKEIVVSSVTSLLLFDNTFKKNPCKTRIVRVIRTFQRPVTGPYYASGPVTLVSQFN